ncbi:MAG TPA: hypothetical protein PK942_08745, partial [Verrucomicrobiota bacterium]|nr:hypothetical protein [Verrucomicrobiota bacterium]
MPKRFQQACGDKHGNFMRFEAEKPSCLGGGQAGGGDFPTEELGLLRGLVHTNDTLIKTESLCGVSNTRELHLNYPLKTPPISL